MRPAARLRWLVAQVLLRVSRWRTTGEVPRKGILVGSPHTSNWDWVLTMLLAWDSGVTIRLLVKQEFFKGPVGWFLLRTGAVPLDRTHPGATIRRLIEESATDETFLLGIAAEGTRSKVDYWKSGFYRISQQTGLPITLAFVGSVIAETVAANSGLGHMMLAAQSQFNVPLVWAGLIMLAVEGIAMYAVMAWIEMRMTGWAHRSQLAQA